MLPSQQGRPPQSSGECLRQQMTLEIKGSFTATTPGIACSVQSIKVPVHRAQDNSQPHSLSWGRILMKSRMIRKVLRGAIMCTCNVNALRGRFFSHINPPPFLGTSLLCQGSSHLSLETHLTFCYTAEWIKTIGTPATHQLYVSQRHLPLF